MIVTHSDGTRRRHDGENIYKEKGKQSWILVVTGEYRDGCFRSAGWMSQGKAYFTALVPFTDGGTRDLVPDLIGGDVSARYLYEKCRPVSWRNVPPEWQKAFLARWFELDV